MSRVVYILLVIFFYIPIAVVGVFSLNSGKHPLWISLSGKWYAELFMYSPQIWHAVQNSLITATGSSLLALAVSLPAAWAWTIRRSRGADLAWYLTYASLLFPDILIGISLLIFYTTIKFELGLVSVILAHTAFNIPFSYLLLHRRFSEIDVTQVDAARDLGAVESRAFWAIIFPQIFGTVISSFLLCFTISLDDFVITFFVSGPGASTLPVHIYGLMRFGISPVVNALSVLVLVVILVAIGISAAAQGGKSPTVSKNRKKLRFFEKNSAKVEQKGG